jgi:hypothetical protein
MLYRRGNTLELSHQTSLGTHVPFVGSWLMQDSMLVKRSSSGRPEQARYLNVLGLLIASMPP